MNKQVIKNYEQTQIVDWDININKCFASNISLLNKNDSLQFQK